MLMHSCYCVFISVTGGFVQMLKDLKNLLKLSLKILFIKRKKENFLPFLLSSDSARWFSSFRWPSSFPRPSTAASSPARLPSPARPSFALSPAQQPRAPRRPGNCRAQPLTPGPHLSAPSPSPRGSATAHARRCSNRRHDARRGRVAPLHGLVKREPRPSAHPCCLFPALLSHLLGPKKPQQPPQHSSDPPCASSRSRRLAVASGPQPSFAVM